MEQYGFTRVRQVVAGGKERYDSVRNGLCALKAVGFAEDGIVLIHDGARPLVNGEIIARAVDGVWICHKVLRSGVLAENPSASAALIVSLTGIDATQAENSRTPSTALAMISPFTSGLAPSWIRTV